MSEADIAEVTDAPDAAAEAVSKLSLQEGPAAEAEQTTGSGQPPTQDGAGVVRLFVGDVSRTTTEVSCRVCAP